MFHQLFLPWFLSNHRGGAHHLSFGEHGGSTRVPGAREGGGGQKTGEKNMALLKRGLKLHKTKPI